MPKIYQVVLTPLAESDLEEAYLYAAKQVPKRATTWYNQVLKLLHTLEQNPERQPYARENGTASVPLRHMLIGNKPHIYRAIFTIKNQQVIILRIRHSKRSTIVV